MKILPQLQQQIDDHPHLLLFASLSGAHLYGFPSPDSDYDIRGAHVLPLQNVIGLTPAAETLDRTQIVDGIEVDVVTHDVKMFFSLLLRKNGNILEQIYSPLVIHTTAEHEELRQIAMSCVTRHHYHHYAGFAHSKWTQAKTDNGLEVKSLLYAFRVLLTGIHLLRTGSVNANLVELNEDAGLSFVRDLIALKTAGPEKGCVDGSNASIYEREYERLRGGLQDAFESSTLEDDPAGHDALNDLLLRLRSRE